MTQNRRRKYFSSKIIFITLLVSILSSLLISFVSMQYAQYHLHDNSRQQIKTLVKIAADSLDGDLLTTIGPEDMDSELYRDVFNFLDGFRSAPDVKYIYTMRKVGSEVQFIVDVDDYDTAPVGEVFPTYREIEQAFSGKVTLDEEISKDVWGNYYSAFAPVHNKAGEVVAIVGIDCSLETIERRIDNTRHSLIIIQLICTLVTGILSVIAAKVMSLYMNEATTDGLTGIYNRKYAISFIDNSLKPRDQFAFLLLDIDCFKAVNDTCGHHVGDCLLKALAEILSNHCRKSDISFRLGGDEFSVFFGQALKEEQLLEIARRIESEFMIQAKALCPQVPQVGLSFGGLVSTRKISFGDMYRRADALLYQVKKSGKRNCQIETIR